MRPVVPAVAGLVVLVTWLALDAGRATVPPPPPPRSRARPQPRAAAAAEMPRRNVFEFVAPAPVARPAPAFVPPPPAPEMPAPSPELPVRLVGLVRRGGALRAALAMAGETVVVGAGERAGDYIVIAVDEDGVRLRTPDGTTISLTPAP